MNKDDENSNGTTKEKTNPSVGSISNHSEKNEKELDPIPERIESEDSFYQKARPKKIKGGEKLTIQQRNQRRVKTKTNKDGGDMVESYVSQESQKSDISLPMGSRTISMINHVNNLESIHDIILEKEGISIFQ